MKSTVARWLGAPSAGIAKVQSFGAAFAAATTSAIFVCGRPGAITISSGARAVRPMVSKSVCGSKLTPFTAWFRMMWLNAEASSV